MFQKYLQETSSILENMSVIIHSDFSRYLTGFPMADAHETWCVCSPDFVLLYKLVVVNRPLWGAIALYQVLNKCISSCFKFTIMHLYQ